MYISSNIKSQLTLNYDSSLHCIEEGQRDLQMRKLHCRFDGNSNGLLKGEKESAVGSEGGV